MEIILSHNNLDFDGLASLLAAKILNPDSHIVLDGKISKNIQEFFALHKDAFPYKVANQLEKEEITAAIIVDTACAKRLGPLNKYFLLHPEKVKAIYDHHPSTPEDFPVGEGSIEQLGAATTILVEKIKEKELKLSSLEATVLALGIYEDTGSLTFSTTTARDVYAVAYLLENGANLSIIANFIDRPISIEQRNLLENLLSHNYIYNIHGYKVLLATAETESYVGGLSIVTHKLAEISNADILFSIVLMDDRIHMVARSRVDAMDVGEIAREFDGGGHFRAASAVIRTQNLQEVTEKLLDLLPHKITPAVTAATIMTAPVKTLSPDISVQEAGKIMLRYGHSGIPVVKNDNVVGIISRRDLDKAYHHGLGHAPVKAFMSSKVVTVTPETPLSEIQIIMMEKDIGRLPVVKNGKLEGIVSRTDVLQTMHGENLPLSFRTNFIQACPLESLNNLSDLMLESLPDAIYKMVVEIGKLADKNKYNVFLVGGLVRDLLLNLPNYDLDIVVEGDGLSFARLLGEKFGAKVRSHEKFGTAVVLLSNGDKIDVATARTEFYEYPAALPSVETSSLKQDLYRRDFTINAMAININATNFGEFIDYFNGKTDLDKKVIRVLYNLSFVEDPTRIIRAVRFEQRYGFVIEEQTMAFAQHAIETKLIEKLSFHRIREELNLILHEINPLPAIGRMQKMGLWKHIMPEVELNVSTWEFLNSTKEFLEFSRIRDAFQKPILYLCTLFANLNADDAKAVLDRFQWPNKERELVQEFLNLRKKIYEIQYKEGMQLSTWYMQLIDYHSEALLAASLLLPSESHKAIAEFCEKRMITKLMITGRDIAKTGIKPGPSYSYALKRLLAAKIAGEIKGKSSELKYTLKLLETEH